MSFNYNTAEQLVYHYQFLIGKQFDNSPSKFKISSVIISPSYGPALEKFWEYFQDEQKFELALEKSGFDKNSVLVFLIDYEPVGNILLYNELDKFLTREKIEKIY